MSNPVRDFTSNTAIGEYYTVYVAIRSHLDKHPPKKGEKQLSDYLNDFGMTQYSQRMRTTTTIRFIDGFLINKDMQK
jgi:DNA-directed RNA polymerase subunit N (RpoN/RPB10)